MGGYEWGAVGTTIKFGFGYMDRIDGNIPCYMGAKAVVSTADDIYHNIVFGTRNSKYDTVVPEERMCISWDGNVGIGTTSPDQILHLAKTASSNNYLRFSITEYSEVDGWDIGLTAYNTYTTNGYDFILKKLRSGTTGNVLIPDGNVGIGTTAPAYKLDFANDNDIGGVPSGGEFIRFACGNVAGNSSGGIIWKTNYGSPFSKFCASIEAITTSNYFRQGIVFKTGNNANYTTNATERMRIDMDGHVGIGTVSPACPLHVSSSNSLNVSSYYIAYNASQASMSSDSTPNRDISIKCDGALFSQNYLFYASDHRIKKNIVDVPDNLALETLRNIPVRYYNYKDTINRGNGNDKTIGFIAQEVKEKFPIAIGLEKDIIPNELRRLENNWNDTTLTTDLQDVSGVKYRFYVSNDPSGNDECQKEIIGNPDNTFTFEKQWNNVFCYGKEVDDFHILDKQKLCALNFSATQEIDKQQQADKAKISELENKVSTLESELAAIKAHLGI